MLSCCQCSSCILISIKPRQQASLRVNFQKSLGVEGLWYRLGHKLCHLLVLCTCDMFCNKHHVMQQNAELLVVHGESQIVIAFGALPRCPNRSKSRLCCRPQVGDGTIMKCIKALRFFNWCMNPPYLLASSSVEATGIDLMACLLPFNPQLWLIVKHYKKRISFLMSPNYFGSLLHITLLLQD